MGAPPEFRTVPETMIAARGCANGVCADAGAQLVGVSAASVAKHTISRITDEGFIAGILLMTGRLARRLGTTGCVWM